MAITLPNTSKGLSDANLFADVYDNDAQLVTELDDRDETYKTLLPVTAAITQDAVAGTYIFGLLGATISGAAALPSAVFYFDDADYTVASKTQKFRVRAQTLTNATAPAINFTFGLYPLTVAGGADLLTATLGTVVSGSTVAINAPSASSVTQGNSGDFTIPSDGAYTFGVVTSGTLANNAYVLLVAHLQSRHV